ncbi:hypothetical protein BC826DRAFT_1064326 [Russula brevipes]|nr:hypothetical protein BC826DRAFT_1064326 [Russula brevipes]
MHRAQDRARTDIVCFLALTVTVGSRVCSHTTREVPGDESTTIDIDGLLRQSERPLLAYSTTAFVQAFVSSIEQ